MGHRRKRQRTSFICLLVYGVVYILPNVSVPPNLTLNHLTFSVLPPHQPEKLQFSLLILGLK